MRPLLMLRLLLLLLSGFAGRLRIKHPVQVLDRSRPAERSRPGEVAIELDEFGQLVARELLLDHGEFHAGSYRTSPNRGGRGTTIGGIQLQPPSSLTRDNAPQAIGLVVGAVFRGNPLPFRETGRMVHRPLIPGPSRRRLLQRRREQLRPRLQGR